jgi:hypothetical protein
MGVAIGDYSNNGLNDIAIATVGSGEVGNVTVYASDGTVIRQWTGLIYPMGVAIGDYSNNGLNDIAIAEGGMGRRVTVYASDGTVIRQWTGLLSQLSNVTVFYP